MLLGWVGGKEFVLFVVKIRNEFTYQRVSFSFHDLPLFLLFSRPTCSPSLHRSSVFFPLLGVVALHTFIISSVDAPRRFFIKTSFNGSCSTVLAARSLPSCFLSPRPCRNGRYEVASQRRPAPPPSPASPLWSPLCSLPAHDASVLRRLRTDVTPRRSYIVYT